jgi:hypothetical protein
MFGLSVNFETVAKITWAEIALCNLCCGQVLHGTLRAVLGRPSEPSSADSAIE